MVTREELREKIWPADTFVDFDHSLNTAVNKIREALGDSASSPRFVETLARRGYRFIASVENAEAETTMPAPALHPELHVPAPRRGLVRALFALIQVMYLIFYVSGLAHLRAAERVAGSFSSGLESSGHRGRDIGDGSGRDSAAVLPAVRGGFRLPQAGR